jgi:hypothetical protein
MYNENLSVKKSCSVGGATDKEVEAAIKRIEFAKETIAENYAKIKSLKKQDADIVAEIEDINKMTDILILSIKENESIINMDYSCVNLTQIIEKVG